MLKILIFLISLVYGKTLKYKDRVFELALNGTGCTFEGSFEGHSNSTFAIYNNCSGHEFAWLQDGELGYYLQDYQNETLFQRHDELERINYTCVLENLTDTKDHQMLKRRTLLTKQFAKVKILTDNLRLDVLGGDVNLLTSSTINIMTIVRQIYLNMQGSEYKIEVNVDSIEHLHGKTPYPWEFMITQSPETVFGVFSKWARENGYLEMYHSVILISGYPLYGGTVGIASMSSFCTGGIAVVESMYSDVSIAKVLAHELGHNLGIRHTNSYVSGSSLDTADKVIECSKESSSVMSPIIYGANYVWDKCSIEWLRMFNLGYPYGCMKGDTTCTYYGGYRDKCFASEKKECGNTIIDPGEECDCGDENECKDPCCNPKTCKLIGVCSPLLHECCDATTCQATTTKRVCRPSKTTECDVDDFCDGVSHTCPKDDRIDFKPCRSPKGIKGSCYGGKCVSHNISCLDVASSGKFNVQIVGPCPRAMEGDIACGNLYCAYDPPPYYCTYISGAIRMQVQEGSSCGKSSYCIGGICQHVTGGETSYTFKPTRRPTLTPTKWRLRCFKKCKWNELGIKLCKWVNKYNKKCKPFTKRPSSYVSNRTL